MSLVKRKPAATEGDRRPRLMAELGIDQWCNIPTAILDALATKHPMEEVRIYACILRASFGWDRPYAVLPSGKPMRQADIEEITGIDQRNLHSKVVKLLSEGWIKQDTEGRFSNTFRSFRINYITRKVHPFGCVFFFSRQDVKEDFFQEWESIESEEEDALNKLREEYQTRKEGVKNKFGVAVERKKLDEIPEDDPSIEVRK